MIDTGGQADNKELFPGFIDLKLPGSETWLDRCAFLAMQSFIIMMLPCYEENEGKEIDGASIDYTKDEVAERSYKMAQAMLKVKRRLESDTK